MSRQLVTRLLALVALAAILVFRSDSRGKEPVGSAKPTTESATKSQSATTRKAMAKQSPPATNETAVQRALAEPVDFNFVDTPLKDVADAIATRHRINLLLDTKALADIGVTPDTPISETIKGVSLRSALRLILQQKGLALIEDGDNVLRITTAEVGKSRVVTKIHDVRKFADPADDFSVEPVSATISASCHGNSIEFSTPPGSWKGIEEVIVSTIVPSSWDSNGGVGSLTVVDGDLIVSQTEEIQSQIADLLTGLEIARHQDPAVLKSGEAATIGSVSSFEAKINRALDCRIDLDFVDTPLKDVVDLLKSKLHTEIQLDAKALSDTGITPDTPFTMKLKHVDARLALREILETKDLTFIIDHEVVLITVTESAKLKTVTEIYPVGDLVAEVGRSVPSKNSYNRLIEAITATVHPSSWDANGGSGTIEAFPVCKVLVIGQTQEEHERIKSLLSLLRSARRNRAETVAVANNTPVLRIYWVPWAGTATATDSKEDQRTVEMIQKLIAPKSWNDPGVYIGSLHGGLVVRQTPDVHRRIESFIAALNGATITPASPKAVPTSAAHAVLGPPAVAPASPPAVAGPQPATPAAAALAAAKHFDSPAPATATKQGTNPSTTKSGP